MDRYGLMAGPGLPSFQASTTVSAEALRGAVQAPALARQRDERGRRAGRGLLYRGLAAALTYNQMVVGGSMVAGGLTGEEVDRLFHALADATRRDILHRCMQGEPSVSRLADVYPMSFAAVQKHGAALERAGMVTKERHGQETLGRTDPDAV